MFSTLNISDRKGFDQAVFSTDTQLDTAKYNEWKQNAVKALQRICNYMDQISCDDAREVEPERPSDTDLYIFGDIINLLTDMTIDAEHRAETWTVTADDFYDYDLSSLSEEEIKELIDNAAHLAQNDGMADYYWEAIHAAAENIGLLTAEDLYLNHNALYVYLRKKYPDNYSKIFLQADVKGDEYERYKSELSDIEIRAVECMTDNEGRMKVINDHWNEDGFIDYESAMEQLISLLTDHPDASVIVWDNGVPSININKDYTYGWYYFEYTV